MNDGFDPLLSLFILFFSFPDSGRNKRRSVKKGRRMHAGALFPSSSSCSNEKNGWSLLYEDEKENASHLKWNSLTILILDTIKVRRVTGCDERSVSLQPVV